MQASCIPRCLLSIHWAAMGIQQICDGHHISVLESALLMLREDGGCYAKSTLPSRCWHTSPRRHDRLCGRWSEDIPSQKPLLCRRPRHRSRDSCPCEHEKLSGRVVAPVICGPDL